MEKLILGAALFTMALSTASFADEMAKSKCDAETMTMVMDAIKKDTDPKMANDTKMATDEMKMADDSMKANKMDDCSMHIDMAKKHMMMK